MSGEPPMQVLGAGAGVTSCLLPRSHPGRVVPGLVVVTNKRLYCLAVTAPETEEPGDWLELLTCADIGKLAKVVGLLGGQGAGLEVAAGHKPPQQTFYRLSSGPGAGDCYYLVLGDRGRTEALVDTLVSRLQEAVRSSPIPVTWSLCRDQEAVVMSQVAQVTQQLGTEDHLEMFLCGHIVSQDMGEFEWCVGDIV